jgi:ATP-dependent helicase/nuclease subunit A
MHFGDCVVLLRTRSHAHAYELALRAARIPYLGADRGTLLDSQEARDLEALLRILTLPYDNLSLAVVLRSALFHASDSDLMQLASPALQGTWMERLETLAPACAPGSPLARAHRCIARWRDLAGRLPVHDLLDRIYCEGNVRSRFVSAAPDHLKSRVGANLDRLIELALEIDSGRYPSIPQFLSRLSDLREQAQDAPDEAAAPAAEPRVRILTIHASKGLEAPVVFLADATHTAHPRRVFQALVDWPADAPRPQSLLMSPRDPDRFSARLLAAQALAEQREDANLLYVALTRARQFLFISGCSPTRAPPPAREESRKRSRLPSQQGSEQRPARSALGWYGEIARSFGLDPHGIPAGTVLTSFGEQPPVSPALQAPAQSTQPASLDPRLSSPLEAGARGPVRSQPEDPMSIDAPEHTPR